MTKIVNNSEIYAQVAAAFNRMTLEILDGTLTEAGIQDLRIRQRVCEKFLFELGYQLDAGEISEEGGEVTAYPFFGIAERNLTDEGLGAPHTIHIPDEAGFEFHEDATQVVNEYFSELGVEPEYYEQLSFNASIPAPTPSGWITALSKLGIEAVWRKIDSCEVSDDFDTPYFYSNYAIQLKHNVTPETIGIVVTHERSRGAKLSCVLENREPKDSELWNVVCTYVQSLPGFTINEGLGAGILKNRVP